MLVADLSPRRNGSRPGQSMGNFWWTKVALAQGLLGVLRFWPVSIIPPQLPILMYHVRYEQRSLLVDGSSIGPSPHGHEEHRLQDVNTSLLVY
jgi:hypothetical protein